MRNVRQGNVRAVSLHEAGAQRAPTAWPPEYIPQRDKGRQSGHRGTSPLGATKWEAKHAVLFSERRPYRSR